MLTVNSELEKLSDWFRANKLSLNVKKTNFILFGNKGRRITADSFYIRMDCVLLERTENTKFLGVHIDSMLDWKLHTSKVSLMISKIIDVIIRVKNILPRSALVNLYNTLIIHPYLLYCNIVWGNASLLALKRLVVLQKKSFTYYFKFILSCSL